MGGSELWRLGWRRGKGAEVEVGDEMVVKKQRPK